VICGNPFSQPLNLYFDPLDFIARLAALVPKARVNLTRLHGRCAPNSNSRSRVTLSECRSRRPAAESETPAARSSLLELQDWPKNPRARPVRYRRGPVNRSLYPPLSRPLPFNSWLVFGKRGVYPSYP